MPLIRIKEILLIILLGKNRYPVYVTLWIPKISKSFCAGIAGIEWEMKGRNDKIYCIKKLNK